jgi:hypothetical protein
MSVESVRPQVDTKEAPTATVYECVVCNKIKEVQPGKKVGIYLKETLGTKNGFICPDCEAAKK